MLNREAASDRYDDQSCCIKFPDNWATPLFHLGQKVYPTRAGDRLFIFGNVVGVYYAQWSGSWIYQVQLSDQCDLFSGGELPEYPVVHFSGGELSEF
jgi:hypothetical protein